MHTHGTNWTYNDKHYDIAVQNGARLLLDAMVEENDTVFDLWNELKIFESELQKHNQLDLFKNEVNRMIRGTNPQQDGLFDYIYHIYNARCNVYHKFEGKNIIIAFKAFDNEDIIQKCALSLAFLGNPTGFLPIIVRSYSRMLPPGISIRTVSDIPIFDFRTTLLSIIHSSKKWQKEISSYYNSKANFMLICKGSYMAAQGLDTDISIPFPKEIWHQIFALLINDTLKGTNVISSAYQEWSAFKISQNAALQQMKDTNILTPMDFEDSDKDGYTPEYLLTLSNATQKRAADINKEYWLNFFKTGAKMLLSTVVWSALPLACFKALSRTTSLGIDDKRAWCALPFLFSPMLIAGTYITLEPIKNSDFKKPKLRLDIELLPFAYTLLNTVTTFLSPLILKRLGYSHLMQNACINFAKPAIIQCLLAPMCGLVSKFANFNPFIWHYEAMEDEHLERTYHADLHYGLLPTYAVNFRRLFIYCAQEYTINTLNAIAL